MKTILAKDAPRCKSLSKNLFTCIEYHLSIEVVTEVIDKIVKHDREQLDAVNAAGDSALMLATCKSRVDVALSLLAAGANTDVVNTDGLTALQTAIRLGIESMWVPLIEGGANVMHIGPAPGCRTILCDAARQGYAALCGRLIDLGACVNHVSKNGELIESPLHEAAASEKPQVASLLISRGARVDILNSSKETPLHLCAIGDSQAVASILVLAGANLSAKTKNGLTPLMTAKKYSNENFFKHVSAVSATLDARNAIDELLKPTSKKIKKTI